MIGPIDQTWLCLGEIERAIHRQPRCNSKLQTEKVRDTLEPLVLDE